MLSKKDKQGLWLILGVFLILGALLLGKMLLDGKPKPRPDNCVDIVTENTVIVLDHTEQVTEQTREEISARALAHIRENVRVNERVTVFTISDLSKKALKPVVSVCRPPDDGNRAVENLQVIRKRFQQNFEVPVRNALGTASGDSKESPIAQALTDISLSQYLRGRSNTLLVFSDMLENTSKFSLYKCNSSAEVIARYRESRRGAMERPEFTNTAVILNFIPRFDQSKETLKCRDQLWAWFFGNNSGDNAGLTVDYLPGGPAMSMAAPGGKK